MLHYKNLNKLFFESFPNRATEFIALSGYVGPEPIRQLQSLPFESKVIFGLQKEHQKILLHNQLTGLHTDECKIFYPDIACHSKCYIWMHEDTPIKGLIGSANFSSNGLYNDFRETLFEVDHNQLPVLKGYIDIIMRSSRECNLVQVVETDDPLQDYNRGICEMILYDPRTGEIQDSHGLNWGFSANGNVRINDACIPLRVEHIRKYPNLFSPIQNNPEKPQKLLNEVVEFVWDDGTVMQGRFEGSQPFNGYTYPKQISSYPHKDDIGKYFRARLGVPLGQRVRRLDLMRYGKDSVKISLIEEGVYYIDFSVS